MVHAISLPSIQPYLSALSDEIFDKGLRLEISNDFDRLVDTVRETPGRGSLTGVFDPGCGPIRPDQCFWIKGVGSKGQTGHIQAVRCDDLTGTTLARHLWKTRDLLAPAGMDVDLDRSRYDGAPAVHEITGTVCYHGEMWLSRGEDGFCGKGLVGPLTCFGVALALELWWPDYAYGLTSAKLVQKGVAARYGYRLQPDGVVWERPDGTAPFVEHLMWLTRQDMLEITQFPRKRAMEPGDELRA